jgi:hypothetical protein
MTEELRRLYDGVPHDVGVALCEAYHLGLNAGLANKLTEGTFEWAMAQMRNGKCIRLRGCQWHLWIPVNIGHVQLVHDYLSREETSQTIMVEFLTLRHWEIVPEPKPEPEGHNFKWAAEQIMCGRWVRRKTWEAGRYLGGEKTTVSVHDTRNTDWVLAWEGQSK